MAEYTPLTNRLPRDPLSARFMGVSGKLFRSFVEDDVVNNDEEAALAVGLVAADGHTPLFGQKTKANSLPITIASDDNIHTTIQAVTAALEEILTELESKISAGDEVALNSATLAALETIELGATTLSALETISLGTGANTVGRVIIRNQTDSGNIDPLENSQFVTSIGSLTETAPTTDTESSGLNGRLQRLAQRLSTLIGLFPTSLGQKTAANSFPVVLNSSHGLATESGQTSLAGGSSLADIVAALEDIVMLLPAALSASGGLKVGIVDSLPAGANQLGSVFAKPLSNALTMVVASGNTTPTNGEDISVYRRAAIDIPANFDGTQISFQGSFQNSGYQDVRDILGDKIVLDVAPSTSRIIPDEVMEYYRFMRVVCLTTQADSDTTFVIHLKG